jgi:hypothetical protein
LGLFFQVLQVISLRCLEKHRSVIGRTSGVGSHTWASSIVCAMLRVRMNRFENNIQGLESLSVRYQRPDIVAVCIW